MSADARRRKRVISLYLREDMIEALERVSSESGLPVSRVTEILLSFQFELNTLLEKERFLTELHGRFRRTL